jgi:hypothetical protein
LVVVAWHESFSQQEIRCSIVAELDERQGRVDDDGLRGSGSFVAPTLLSATGPGRLLRPRPRDNCWAALAG